MDRNEKLALINKNTLESLEDTDILRIIARFTQTAMDILSADFGFMFWKSEHQNTYQLIYTSPETPYKPKLPRKGGYNDKASRGRIPYFVTNPRGDLLPYMKSIAIIPIFYKNHQYGNIIICFRKRRIFKPEDKPLVTTLGNSAAQVITIYKNQRKVEKDSQKILRQKDEFFNIVSHELKTPVTTIKGFSQILCKKLENTEAKYLLDRIDNQLDKLTHLINDLLEVSRIDRGKLLFYKSNCELHKLVQHVVEGLKVAITDHPITCKITHQMWTHCDSARIESVLINLIINAAKYSRPGSKIKVSLKEQDGKALIEVEDFGYGISNKDKTKVFGRFYRSKKSNRRNLQGLGLGLYIANSIIKRHGGTLDFRSKKDRGGTIFYFTLPCNKSKANKKS